MKTGPDANPAPLFSASEIGPRYIEARRSADWSAAGALSAAQES